MAAKARAEWRGQVQSGWGTFTAGDTLTAGYTYKSQFEGGPGPNLEQLIGAAEVACFSMALASALAKAGAPPEVIVTDADVTLQMVDSTPTIPTIALRTIGKVSGLGAAVFESHAQAEKTGSPVNRALASVPENTLQAVLEA